MDPKERQSLLGIQTMKFKDILQNYSFTKRRERYDPVKRKEERYKKTREKACKESKERYDPVKKAAIKASKKHYQENKELICFNRWFLLFIFVVVLIVWAKIWWWSLLWWVDVFF